MNALFGGVNAAVLTPMNDDLSPDLDRMAAHCRHLLARGCDGLAVLGTTGEANSLGVSERMALLEGLLSREIPVGRLLPGTGLPSITDTVALTRHAAALGCRGVLMLPPFFYKQPSDDGLFAWFSEVLNRVGEGPAIYLYHFPQQSAVPFSLDLIGRLIRAFAGTVRGMKDSSGDFAFTASVARAHAADGFEVYCGDDAALLDLLGLGGAGCITAVANIGSALAAEVCAQARSPAGEAAQRSLTALRRAVTASPLIPGLKALMARETGDAGWAVLRPPHLPLDSGQSAALLGRVDGVSGSATEKSASS